MPEQFKKGDLVKVVFCDSETLKNQLAFVTDIDSYECESLVQIFVLASKETWWLYAYKLKKL